MAHQPPHDVQIIFVAGKNAEVLTILSLFSRLQKPLFCSTHPLLLVLPSVTCAVYIGSSFLGGGPHTYFQKKIIIIHGIYSNPVPSFLQISSSTQFHFFALLVCLLFTSLFILSFLYSFSSCQFGRADLSLLSSGS